MKRGDVVKVKILEGNRLIAAKKAQPFVLKLADFQYNLLEKLYNIKAEILDTLRGSTFGSFQKIGKYIIFNIYSAKRIDCTYYEVTFEAVWRLKGDAYETLLEIREMPRSFVLEFIEKYDFSKGTWLKCVPYSLIRYYIHGVDLTEVIKEDKMYVIASKPHPITKPELIEKYANYPLTLIEGVAVITKKLGYHRYDIIDIEDTLKMIVERQKPKNDIIELNIPDIKLPRLSNISPQGIYLILNALNYKSISKETIKQIDKLYLYFTEDAVIQEAKCLGYTDNVTDSQFKEIVKHLKEYVWYLPRPLR